MEVTDTLISITFGILGGIWTGILFMIITKLIIRPSMLRIMLLAIGPAIAWYIIAFIIIAIKGGIVSDVIGMPALMTGVMILALSIIGLVLEKVIPAMLKGMIFVSIITFTSVAMQLLWSKLR